MDLLHGLTGIGFTEYEAKVYMALLQENPATGYHLSKKSGVPRSMVYEALSRLSLRGAVMETIEERATYYRPLPPEVLLDRYQEEQRQLLADIRAGLETFSAAADNQRVWSISGRQATLAYARQMIRAAEHEMYLVLSDDDLDILRPDIADAHGRGIGIKALLTGEGNLEFGHVAHHPPQESKMQQLNNTLLLVVDDAKALIASTHQGDVATITSNRNLVLIARQFVWMELFAQRMATHLGPDAINKLDPEDQSILCSHSME